MKTYVKPSFQVVQLRAEEGIACSGSSAKVDITYPLPKFDFNFNGWFGGFGDLFSKLFTPKKHNSRRN